MPRARTKPVNRAIPEFQYAAALTKCLAMAKDVQREAIFSLTPDCQENLAKKLIDHHKRMEDEVFQIVGQRYYVPG